MQILKKQVFKFFKSTIKLKTFLKLIFVSF